MVEDLHTAGVTVKLLCDTVEVSRSGYYAWLKRPASERTAENETLLARIKGKSSGGHARVVRIS